MEITNFIDLHVHIGPEVLPRKFTVPKIVKEERGKIKGMALKNHLYPTTPLIKSTEEPENLILVGSVTLNNYVGGLNQDAVYSSAKLSRRPIIVWFPTISAGNFLKKSRYEIPPEWGKVKSRLSKEVKGIKTTDKNGKLTKDARGVLKAIKENGCILATGHVSWLEAKTLVKAALKIGVKKIIITHPIYQLIDMPVEVQKELVENEGVYIEQAYSMYLIDKIPMEKIASQINAVGAENCIITSDMGQVNNPSPSVALKKFIQLLKREGVTEKELKIMGEINPERLIALKKR